MIIRQVLNIAVVFAVMSFFPPDFSENASRLVSLSYVLGLTYFSCENTISWFSDDLSSP